MEHLYKGKFLQVVEKDNHEIVSVGYVVAVIPEFENQILLVRHYRPSLGCSILEIPAGWVEEQEDIKVAAKRELKEETGFEAKELKFLTSYYATPGYSTEKVSLFVARNLHKTGGIRDEIEELVFCSPNIIKTMLKKGQIVDAKTLIGLLIYFNKLKK